MAFAPADHHVATEALAWFQGADPRVELGTQSGAGGLQDPVGTLDLSHTSFEAAHSCKLRKTKSNTATTTKRIKMFINSFKF